MELDGAAFGLDGQVCYVMNVTGPEPHLTEYLDSFTPEEQ